MADDEEYAIDPDNVRELQVQFLKHLDAKTKEEGIAKLEDAVRRSDGRMKENFEAMLVILREDLGEL